MVLLSITGVVKMILIILGVIVVLRVVGRMMIAKRNLDEERDMLRRQRENEHLASEAKRNYGKTTIGKVDKKSLDGAEYADFEEVK